MIHGNPIYVFKLKSQKFLTFIGGIFAFGGGFGTLFFFFSQMTGAYCTVNGRSLPCYSTFSPYIITGTHFLLGLGLMYLGFLKAETITCYTDGIESSRRGFIDRNNMIAIDYFRYWGNKGVLWIRTKSPIKLPMGIQTNTLDLKDITDVETVFQKIQLCYNLPHKELIQRPLERWHFNQNHRPSPYPAKISTGLTDNQKKMVLTIIGLFFLCSFIMFGLMFYFINSAFRP